MRDLYAVILAGGGGTRLWPLSRQKRPKQSLALFNERTLFQNTLGRLWGLVPPEQVLVVTIEEQVELLRQQAPSLPEENILAEPLPRGTAAAAGLAWLALRHRGLEEATLAILPSDHYMANPRLFQQLLRAGCAVARRGFVVTIGITPDHPATGYGYIQMGAPLGEFDGVTAYRVLRFKEKPDLETAQRMLEQGDHVWNAGIFLWSMSVFWEETRRHLPPLAHALQQALEKGLSPASPQDLRPLWEPLPSETIDYGIMEKTHRAAVLPAPRELGWSDVGSWDALFDLLAAQHGRRAIIVGGADQVVLDSQDLLVYLDDRPRLVAAIHADDLIVVVTDDALLVCRRGETQRVREVVRILKRKGAFPL